MSELPKGWARLQLQELVGPDGVFIDGDWVESKDQDPNGEVRLIQLADIGDGLFRDRSARFLTRAKAAELRCTFLEKNDLLIARMPDPLGRCCIFPLDVAERFVTVVDVCVLRPGRSVITPRFLMYAINSMAVRSEIAGHQSGSTRKRISRGNLATVTVPVAPLAEQHRIVAKIEELFSELDASEESLTRARAQLGLYRQSLLKAAFQGSLTADWRAANPEKLETPETLLARIRKEREDRYRQALDDWQTALSEWRANGEEGRKPAKPGRPSDDCLDLGELPELPFGWAYAAFGQLAYAIRNGISETPDPQGTLPILRISAVRPLRCDHADHRFLRPHEDHRDFLLQRGDLLFTRYNGSRAFVGVAALYRGDGSHVYPDKLIRCDLRLPSIDVGFLEQAVNCGEARAFIESRIRTTAGQAGISGADLKAMPVPICGIEEQIRIRETLDTQLSGIEATETEITTALTKISALRQSILKKAFTGELVPQDPADEPAATLLARIRAEALATGPQRKKNSVTKRTEKA